MVKTNFCYLVTDFACYGIIIVAALGVVFLVGGFPVGGPSHLTPLIPNTYLSQNIHSEYIYIYMCLQTHEHTIRTTTVVVMVAMVAVGMNLQLYSRVHYFYQGGT